MITLAKGESINLNSIRKYGLHDIVILGFNADVPPQFDVFSDLSQNYDLSITIDVKNVPNPINLINSALGYEGVHIALTEHINGINEESRVNVFEYDYKSNKDFLIVKFGKLTARLEPKENYEYLTRVLYSSIIEKKTFDNYLKLLTNFLTHKNLERNIFVSDISATDEIKSRFINNHSMMIIKSEQLIPIIECIERRFGRYYHGPRMIESKGLYYRRLLNGNLQNYDKMWATAVYGSNNGIIKDEIFDFAKSLSDRCLSLLEVIDEIKYLTLESPNNEAEWDLVNKLNYFFMLITGLFDNLAWLTALHYSLEKDFHFSKFVLRFQQKNEIKPNKFHLKIEENNSKLFTLIKEFQDVMAIFYPIRDSIQHRFVLSGIRVGNIEQKWVKVMVKIDDLTTDNIKALEETNNQEFNSWGLFLINEDSNLIEPLIFSKKAINEIFQFTDNYLNYLNLSELIKDYPEICAEVMVSG